MRLTLTASLLIGTLALAGCSGAKHLRDAANEAGDTAAKVGAVVGEAGKTMTDVTQKAVNTVNQARLLVSGLANTLQPEQLTGVVRSNDQTFLVSGGDILALVDTELTLKTGLRVQPSGQVTLASGTTTTLTNDQMIDMTGAIRSVDTNIMQQIVEFRAMLSSGKKL